VDRPVADRSHLSIGEVLSLLREEFPDVTISKIRFLESQGLVDPERTPSGYRKFYEHDVERLRWILRQQRENFLPLKVIRGRLTGQDPEEGEAPGAEGEATPDESGPAPSGAPAGEDPGGGPSALPAAAPSPAERSAPDDVAPARRSAATPSIFAGLRGDGPNPSGSGRPAAPATAVATPPAPTTPASPSVPTRSSASRGAGGASPSPDSDGEPDTYTAEELAEAAGTTLSVVSDLRQYGLITPHAAVAGTAYFDAQALAVARVAGAFAVHGVEARHLRVWKNSAEREADLYGQVVMPLLRQRNPQARKDALATLADLSRLGGELRSAMVDKAVREIR
jgi:DNA-binding transcriptional MerR regulator